MLATLACSTGPAWLRSRKHGLPLGSHSTVPSPPLFDFANPDTWEQWIRVFEDFFFALGLHHAAGEVQVRTLLYLMGSHEARRILKTFGLSLEALLSFYAVKGVFTSHFVHPNNKVYASVVFHRCIQEPGESMDTFFTGFRSLVNKSDFASTVVQGRLVRDRFVVGLRDKALVGKLCQSLKLSWDEARVQACVHEDAGRARDTVFAEFVPGHAVAETCKNDSEGRQCSGKNQQRTRTGKHGAHDRHGSDNPCRYCGHAAHPYGNCPTRDILCSHRKRKGHFAAVCEQRDRLGSPAAHGDAAPLSQVRASVG